MKYSIIIPHYGAHLDDLLKPCVESIIKYTTMSDVEVIVVANGCTDGVAGYINSLGESFKLVWFENGIGYTRATNEGLKIAKGDYLIPLNNDVVLLGQEKDTWLKMLTQPFIDNDKVGITGPMQAYCPHSTRNFLIFFCVMIKRDVINKIGYLDEAFSPGFGEDVDYCVRAQIAGYETVQVNPNLVTNNELKMSVGEFPIYHKSEATFSTYPGFGKIINERWFMLQDRYNDHIKLNLGCGNRPTAGFFNVDICDQAADMHWDVRRLPLSDNKVEEIFSSHLIEHFKIEEVQGVLNEWYRILKKGGKLTLECPDVEALCDHFMKADKGGRYHMLNCIFGAGTPDFPHKYGWYWDILYDHLWNAGFKNITIKQAQVEHWGFNIRVECTKEADSLYKDLPEGFFADHDIETYRDFVKNRVPVNGVIAELGCWKGRSLCSIADIIKEKNIQVIAVDTFEGSTNEGEGQASSIVAMRQNIKDQFIANISKVGLNVEIRQGTTHDMSKEFPDNYFDMVFIDANHDFENGKQDISDWWPKVKRGGVLAGHDVQWKQIADALTTQFGHLCLTNWNNIWFVDRHKVYDCFPFCNELDQLEIRLNELNDEVDYFVIVEGTETHSGKPKPLYFEENKQRFEKFLPKIRHIVIDQWPEYVEGNLDSAWIRERMQRDAIMQGLHDARFCDVVIISDADEIPRASSIKTYKRHLGITSIEMQMFYYYLNYLSNDNDGKWLEAKILPFAELKGRTPCHIRYWNKDMVMFNAGWHFSFQGGVDEVIKKIDSWAHQEYNRDDIKNREKVERLIDEGKDVFDRDMTYKTIKIDESFPKYVLGNCDKFKMMIIKTCETKEVNNEVN